MMRVRANAFGRLSVVILFLITLQAQTHARMPDQLSLTPPQASHFASLALKCIQKEFPNKLDHTINDKDDVHSPRAMHPSFYGCFDWPSTVRGHWMLVHLLQAGAGMPDANGIRRARHAHMTEVH